MTKDTVEVKVDDLTKLCDRIMEAWYRTDFNGADYCDHCNFDRQGYHDNDCVVLLAKDMMTGIKTYSKEETG